MSVMAHHSPRLFPWSKHVLNSKAKEWNEWAAIQPQGLLVQPVLKGHYYIRVQLLSHYTMLLWTILFRYTLRGTSQMSDHYFNESYWLGFFSAIRKPCPKWSQQMESSCIPSRWWNVLAVYLHFQCLTWFNSEGCQECCNVTVCLATITGFYVVVLHRKDSQYTADGQYWAPCCQTVHSQWENKQQWHK